MAPPVARFVDTNTGLPTSITGRDGQTTQISYNAQLQPTQITDPKNQVTTFHYALNGLDVKSIVNAQGQTVAAYQFDSKHQPTYITDLTGTVTTLTYTAWGAPKTVTANGHTTQMFHNARGFVSTTQRDGVTLGSTTYDEKGRVATQTDQVNLTVAYEYNNIDHVTKESYPDGTSVSYDYTCCGLPGVVTDRAGRKSYYDYDPMRRLARVQDAKGDTPSDGLRQRGQPVASAGWQRQHHQVAIHRRGPALEENLRRRHAADLWLQRW